MSRRAIGAAVLLCLALAGALLVVMRRPEPARTVTVPLATPPGITLQARPTAAHEAGTPEPERLYADAQGHTLYRLKSRPGGPFRCEADCARDWQPVLAPPASEPMGEWTLLRRPDRTLQWALHGDPLYRYTGDTQVGDTHGASAAGAPWVPAVFRPGEGLALAAGIGARELADAAGVSLVDAQGLTLYLLLATEPGRNGCGPECQSHWLPLEAPAIADGTRDFSVLHRPDGITQWTFRGRALYRFDGDQVPGNANGIGVSSLYSVALVLRYFMPPDVAVVRDPALGRILATREGRTLYQRDRVDAAEGGHSFRADHGAPELGRLFGTASCDASCTREWPVYRAPAAAQPSGYWQIAVRADGTRQWVYRGYALYTYAAERPGETRGNDLYDFPHVTERGSGAPLSPAPVPTVDGVPIDPAAVPGAGIGAMFWHAVVP